MYKIRLPNFEGPFDLLLYFIRRDELNIYDIPISRITEEFLKYVRLMKYFDLELAGEFLVMAATLMYIKLQMLLPHDEDEESGEIEDPRTQLVQRLIEYKQFKYASSNLSAMSEEQRYTYYRQLFEADVQLAEASTEVVYRNSSIFDLLKAFKDALDRKNFKEPTHMVALIPVTVEEKTEMIISKLNDRKRIKFFSLVENETRQGIVVTFLAILELIKSGKIFILQSDIFGEIVISKRPEMSLN